MVKSISKMLAATTTNDMSLLDLLLYYQKPDQYIRDGVEKKDMVTDIRAIAAILLGGGQ